MRGVIPLLTCLALTGCLYYPSASPCLEICLDVGEFHDHCVDELSEYQIRFVCLDDAGEWIPCDTAAIVDSCADSLAVARDFGWDDFEACETRLSWSDELASATEPHECVAAFELWAAREYPWQVTASL